MPFLDFANPGQPEFFGLLAVLGLMLIVINYLLNYLPLSSFPTTHLGVADETPPVSLIICAKNEDENLTEFLPKILSQEYPDYEVIVVNDCSWDNTENVIDEFTKIFPHLRKATIKEDPYYKHGKKFAMLVGIKAAKNNHMLFTDADCFPSSNHWLKEMARGFSGGREIVLGYGAYEKGKGLLNDLIRFDAFMIAVQYFSSAIKGRPYMGVGRNLAYTNELFFRQKGFSTHYHINSGDDDLFVNQSATADNTNICISADAITYSKPKKTFRDWNIQKTRHLTTAPLYSSASKGKILFNFFSQYFFHLSLIPLCFSLNSVLLLPILLILKVGVQTLVLLKGSRKLQERDLLAGAALYELILLFIYPIFQVSKLFYKPNKWTN
jgi:biofilm PGA synthesis N-glycosyltransferase PgaC